MTGSFRIRVARIEAASDEAKGQFADITFRIENESGSFYIPVRVSKDEFDDADLTKVARSVLHQTMVSLSQATERWKLTEQELEQLSSWKHYQGA
jgi:hypothetical protein